MLKELLNGIPLSFLTKVVEGEREIDTNQCLAVNLFFLYMDEACV
jgi:hypothetical protein